LGGLAFALVAGLWGFSYGESGDPSRYAEQFLSGCQRLGEPIYCAVTWVGGLVSGIYNIEAVDIAVLSSLQIGLAFYLISNRISTAMLALGLYTLTTQGFLVTFNLYRTSLALLVFALFYRMHLQKKARFFLPAFLSGFAHNAFFMVAAAANRIYFVAVVVAFSFFLVIPELFAVLSDKTAFYSEKILAAWRNADAAVMPVTFLINMGVWFFLRRFRQIQEIGRNLSPLGLMLLMQLGFLAMSVQLAYERISAVFLFMAISLIVKSRCYRYSKSLIFLMVAHALNTLRHFTF